MPQTSEHGTPVGPPEASTDLAASQVKALFSDVRSFVVGSIGVCVAGAVLADRTQSGIVLGATAALAIIAGVRLASIVAYNRTTRTASDAVDHIRWQRFYNAGAALQIACISLLCLSVFLVTESPLDRMLAMATVLAYMAGIPGRNFANPFGVNVQIVFGAIPLLIAMAVAGQSYWLMTCILFLPYFIALKGLANRLRGIFVEATLRAHDLSSLAARFDTALNNMSHGLAMFDDKGRITICNRRLYELLLLDEGSGLQGQPIAALLAGAADDQFAQIARLHLHIERPVLEPIEIGMRNDTRLEFTFQLMAGGGAVAVVQDVTERKRAAARIHQLALYDELTGLVNRANLRGILATRLANRMDGERHALLFVDLDHFKQVNDTLGHCCGDVLIRQVAERLSRVADGDVVARFGGDEFVVLHKMAGSAHEVGVLAADVIATLSAPYRIQDHDVVIGASIGVALSPDHGTSPDELLKKADLALYRAKMDGRGSYRTFEPSMSAAALARSELELDLRRALKNEEFELHFQPIYNLKEERYTTCEALLRWRHPQRGLVSPGEFIPVAEDMGLIVDIGAWVLREACRACRTWPEGVRVAVNISPLQFRRGDIVTTVKSALENSGLHPSRLELELTESVLLQDVAYARVTMRLLHMQQVAISLDDFGTGYSSLSYLNELPLSKVKIDRSFLAGLESNPKSMLMLKGLARLGAELGLATVIEGVETEHQLKLITSSTDVEEVQGFLFSRPVPLSEIGALLAPVRSSKTGAPRLRLAHS